MLFCSDLSRGGPEYYLYWVVSVGGPFTIISVLVHTIVSKYPISSIIGIMVSLKFGSRAASRVYNSEASIQLISKLYRTAEVRLSYKWSLSSFFLSCSVKVLRGLA